MRQDDQANYCMIVADHKQIPQRRMILSQVDSLAAYQFSNLPRHLHCWQQVTQNAGRFSSQPLSQIILGFSIRTCLRITYAHLKHFLLSISARKPTIVVIPTITKEPNTPVLPQHHSHEIMILNLQAHGQKAVDFHQDIVPDVDRTIKTSSMVPRTFSHYQLPKQSIREPQTCPHYLSV